MQYVMKIFFLGVFIPNVVFASVINLDNNLEIAIQKTYGGDSIERIKYLNKFLTTITPNMSQIEKLTLVNNFFNKFTYLKDVNHWKKDDYWPTLIEFVSTGAGDSEDFAMAKYFLLIKLGFDKNKFELLYDLNEYQFTKIDDPEHIVLSYKYSDDSKIIILDCVHKKLKVLNDFSKYKQIEKSKPFILEHLNKMLEFR